MKKEYQKPVVEKKQVSTASDRNCCGMWNHCGNIICVCYSYGYFLPGNKKCPGKGVGFSICNCE